MATELKKSVVRGMAWLAFEKVGVMLFQMLVGFVLMLILVPEDFAVVGILWALATICSVFVDSGFSAAIIRKREVSDGDLTAVFLFNVLMALTIYGILVGVTPFVARYYDLPEILSIAPIIFLIIPINSLCIIQSTILTRRLEFKLLSKYALWANFIASGVAVGMAFAGFGVWALVAQRLTTPFFRALLLWVRSEWRPRQLTLKPLRHMAGYSSRLLASDFVNSLYANISQLFIGKMYHADQLGYYEQARKWKDMPVTSVVSAIQGVTFPALSKLQDDEPKMSLSAHQVVTVMNFFMYPLMIGLIAVVGDFFAAVVPERWWPALPYFRILCISGLFVPLSVVSYNILKIKSNGKMIFRLEMIKKAIATVVLVATIPVSVKAVVWGQVCIFMTDAIINAFGAGRYIRWRFIDRLKEIGPYLLFSLIMWAALHGVGLGLSALVVNISAVWILIAKIITGAVVYLGLCRIFKPEAWGEVVIILRQMNKSEFKHEGEFAE